MSKKFTNPCTRCGTERIVLRTWKEKIYNSVIVNTEMICPNKECQKQVTKDNKKQVDRYEALKRKSEEHAIERRAAIHAQKLKNPFPSKSKK